MNKESSSLDSYESLNRVIAQDQMRIEDVFLNEPIVEEEVYSYQSEPIKVQEEIMSQNNIRKIILIL